MGRRLIDALEDAIWAEGLAAELRKAHGAEAEQFCDGMIETHARKDPEWERLQDVRRALRWV